MTRLVVAIIVASAGVYGQRATEPSVPEFKDPPSEMRGAIERYTADRGALSRFYKLERSPARAERMLRFYSEWRASLGGVKFDALRQDDKVDWILFRNHLDHELRQLDLDAKMHLEIAKMVPFAEQIIAYEEARRRMEPVDPKRAAGSLDGLRKTVAETQRTVQAWARSSAIAKTQANRAAGEVIALRSILTRWFSFYNGYDPLFTWWAAEAYRQADAALLSYATYLREQLAGVKGSEMTAAAGGRPVVGGGAQPAGRAPQPDASRNTSRMDTTDDIVGNPIGREGLLSELAHEMIPYTPEELIAIANREFEWCEKEMRRASAELGYRDDWKKALEHVKNLYVEPGKQPALIRDLAREAEAFLDEHDLITIPPLARETWRMEMMSPERQAVNPFFLGGEVIQVSYPVDSMTYDQKLMSMRGNNIHFSRATVFHELIPGHELQGFMAARHRPYRSLFSTPFLTEGWSLYWEMLLWDMKFQKSAEDRVGALFWRMHRCARIIFSLSFHLGNMTPQQCVDFLVDRVGHERANAIGEVRRSFEGSYSPLYQAAYLLGGMQLYALHKELVGSGKMMNRQFHDSVLKLGRIPVEMIRVSLTGEKVGADFQTRWRFYGEAPGPGR